MAQSAHTQHAMYANKSWDFSSLACIITFQMTQAQPLINKHVLIWLVLSEVNKGVDTAT